MPDKPVSVEQVLREWPPGYGGVERVAHELASVWGGAVYSLDCLLYTSPSPRDS